MRRRRWWRGCHAGGDITLHAVADRFKKGLVVFALALLTACATVDSPRPGEGLGARPGRTLVFGHIRFVEGEVEYRPWDPGRVIGPEVYLALLRLDRRRVTPRLTGDADGTFYWWLAPGDYALVGNRHALLAADALAVEMQDMAVLALLRVPAEITASYAGELMIEVMTGGLELRGLTVPYEFRGAHVSDRREEARRELERLYGPLPGPPAIRLMYAGPEIPAFRDPDLASRARGLFDRATPAE